MIPTISLSTNQHFLEKSDNSYKLGNGWQLLTGTIDDVKHNLQAGHPICVASLSSDRRADEHFVSSQIIGLDFDQGPDVAYFHQLDDFCKKYAALAASTASSTVEKPRTRVFFILDQPVTDAMLYRGLVQRLMYKFRHLSPDLKTGQASQIFFGNTAGNYQLFEGNNVLPIALIYGIDIPKDKIDPRDIQIIFNEEEENNKRAPQSILNEGSDKGSRNADALALVGRYSNFMEKTEVEFMMKAWYGKLKDKADFRYAEIQSMINRMYDKSDDVRRKVQKTLYDSINGKPTPIRDLKKLRSKIATFSEFICTGEEKIEWLVEGWLPCETTAVMSAPPMHFKTWTALSIAMSIGTGKPLFGRYRVPKRGKVLVIQLEDAKYITKQRVKLIYAELCKSDPEATMIGDLIDTGMTIPNVHFWQSETPFTFASDEAMSELEQLIQEEKYDLVIIDPLYAAADSSDYMAKDAGRLMALKRMRDKYHCAFLILHHTKKMLNPDAKGARALRTDIWGSQFLNAWMETGIHIRSGKEPDTVIITRHFKITDKSPTSEFKFDICTDDDNPHFIVTEQDVVATKTHDDPIALFNRHSALTVSDYAAKSSISVSTASRRLNKLVEKGVLTKNPNHSYSLLTIQADI